METKYATNAARKTRIFLVEDHPVVCEGLKLLIGGDAEISVCGSAGSIADAKIRIRELSPDLALIDITLGDGNGLDLIKELHQQNPKLLMMALSMHDESVYAERALRAGARGYVMKSEAMDTVRTAIHRVLAGEIYVSEKMVSRMLHKLATQRVPDQVSSVNALSDREFQVFSQIAEGVGPTEIARKLNVSVKTIETHREHIKDKLGLKSGSELTRFAMQWQTDRR
jgi:DNA-binding NarL/FixJ family response regulator